MSRRAKTAVVRFYLDAYVLGLAHIVVALRSDATHLGDPGAIVQRRGRPPCPIADRAGRRFRRHEGKHAQGWRVRPSAPAADGS